MNFLPMLARRERLCRSFLPCPACGTRQVQLMLDALFIRFTWWRCRECGHRFMFEPMVRA